MLRTLTVLAAVVAAPISADAAVQTKKVSYKHGDLECQGFLAWDDAVEGRRPGVLVVHEWWGLNDYARQRAEQLAKLGYVAFAADMYGEGKTAQHPKEALEMSTKVRANVEDWRKRASHSCMRGFQLVHEAGQGGGQTGSQTGTHTGTFRQTLCVTQ